MKYAVQEVASEDGAKGRTLTVRFELPQWVAGAQDVDLLIEPPSAHVLTETLVVCKATHIPASKGAELTCRVVLPQRVDESGVRAKFIRSKHVLSVSLPVIDWPAAKQESPGRAGAEANQPVTLPAVQSNEPKFGGMRTGLPAMAMGLEEGMEDIKSDSDDDPDPRATTQETTKDNVTTSSGETLPMRESNDISDALVKKMPAFALSLEDNDDEPNEADDANTMHDAAAREIAPTKTTGGTEQMPFKTEPPPDPAFKARVAAAGEEELRQAALVLKEKGNEHVKAQRHAQALTVYTQSLALFARDPAVYSNRALCHINTGDFESAILDGKRCIQLDPGFVRAYERLGDSCAALGDMEGAVEWYRKGLVVDPSHKGCQTGLTILTDEEMPMPSSSSGSGSERASSKEPGVVEERKGAAPGSEETAPKKPGFGFRFPTKRGKEGEKSILADSEARDGQKDRMAKESHHAEDKEDKEEKAVKVKPEKRNGKGSAMAVVEHTLRGRPIEVRRVAGKGRGVFSTADLRAGDEVLATGPLACVVHDKYMDGICHQCFQPLQPHGPSANNAETAATRKPIPCASGCGGVVYCSRTCAKEGEEHHAGECQVLQAWKAQAQSAAMQKATRGLRMFIRLAYAVHRDPGMAQVADILEQEPGAEGRQDLLGMAGAVNRFVMPPFRLEPAKLAALISKTQKNMHGIADLAGHNLGHGLYPLASFFNHSCAPNAVVSFRGNNLVVRCLDPISSGSEITIAYVELYAPREVRQRQLQLKKGFLCQCPRCLLPKTDPRERKISDGREDLANKAREGWDKGLVQYQSGDFAGSKTTLDGVLQIMEGWLGQEHQMVFETHKLLTDVCLVLNNTEGVERHAQQALRCMKAHLHTSHPSIALFSMHLARALLERASGAEKKKCSAAVEHARRACKVLRVAYGAEHPSIVEAEALLDLATRRTEVAGS